MKNPVSTDEMASRFDVHPDVLKLGLVSFLTDLSSEMIFSVFAIFFTTIAGASAALLGMIEGLADLSASSLNYFAGWLSDRSGRRKVFALAGYGFSTLAKIILLAATTLAGLGVFRVVERLGKGFRGPPRDAWLSALADQERRGYSFGVHKALDKAGAVAGPLAAYALLSWLGEGARTFRILFWIALVPALLSIVVLCFITDQPGVRHGRENMLDTWETLSPDFKRYLVPAGIFSLAYFSFGFLLLRAHGTGFSVKDIVLLYALFNLSFVVASPLIGRLGDSVGRARIIMLGYLIYLLMSLGFAFATRQWQTMVLFVLYGVFFAIDEAQSKAFIADIELERRASAIGLYNFVTGLLYLPASLIAGALWRLHPASAFLAAACLALAALIAFAFLRPGQRQRAGTLPPGRLNGRARGSPPLQPRVRSLDTLGNSTSRSLADRIGSRWAPSALRSRTQAHRTGEHAIAGWSPPPRLPQPAAGVSKPVAISSISSSTSPAPPAWSATSARRRTADA